MKLHGKTNPELLAMAAHKLLDAIARQITWNMSQARAAAGHPVPCDGYSGRQSNRRR